MILMYIIVLLLMMQKTLIVDFEGGIEKSEVIGLLLELNTVKCANLSATGFLSNNDFNTTASCSEMDFSTDSLFTIRASLCLWHYMFDKTEKKSNSDDTFDLECYGTTT